MLSGSRNNWCFSLSLNLTILSSIDGQYLGPTPVISSNPPYILDLSRLSTSLKAANKDLNEYYGQLTKIGPQGQEAFLKLAKSISTAEAPVTRVNAKLAEMGTTLKNTVRWQLSSSIIHGFMGTIAGAYGYAQDLNESLNNIRIVTGQSVDEMAKFAEKANASAKA